jgi:hypothetical protein
MALELLELQQSAGMLVLQAARAVAQPFANHLSLEQTEAILRDNLDRFLQLQARMDAWRAESAAQKPTEADKP